MRAVQLITSCGLLLALAASAAAAPGDIVTAIPAPNGNSQGMAYDGKHLWIADRLTDQIYRVVPADGTVVDSLPTPGFEPLGLTWDGENLWCLDGANQEIYAINIRGGDIEKTISCPVAQPTGIAWDGEYLWLADDAGNKIYRISTDDGEIVTIFRSPTAYPCDLTFDGAYLWVADRYNDEIYMVAPATGDVVITLPAPGPHAWGLTWDGKHLWNVDYQTDSLYQLVANDDTPYARYDGKAERIEMVHQVRNFGPDTLTTLNISFALPDNGATQDLLGSIEFIAPPSSVTEDKWGQKVAHYEYQNVPPNSFTDLRMIVPAMIYKTRFFVRPENVGSLDGIPDDIRIRYLTDDDNYDMTNSVIRKALKESIDDEKNPYWIGRKIYNYVIDKLEYELAGGWQAAPEVLERGTGSCSEYSFVYIAMCRAAGLPARFAGSTVIRGDDASTDRIFHRWVEIYLPDYGWIPVDPSGGDSPWPASRADNFGHLDNRYLITTVGAGDSEFLGWSYNTHEWWTAPRRCNVVVDNFAEWSPLKNWTQNEE